MRGKKRQEEKDMPPPLPLPARPTWPTPGPFDPEICQGDRPGGVGGEGARLPPPGAYLVRADAIS